LLFQVLLTDQRPYGNTLQLGDNSQGAYGNGQQGANSQGAYGNGQQGVNSQGAYGNTLQQGYNYTTSSSSQVQVRYAFMIPLIARLLCMLPFMLSQGCFAVYSCPGLLFASVAR
jgi:hypothetical protein